MPQQRFLINPKGKRSRRATRKTAAKRARPKRKRVTRRKTSTRSNPVATKRKRSTRRKSAAPKRNPPARRRKRRTYRRNPAISVKGVTKQLTEGFVNAGIAVGGKVFARAVPRQLGLPTTGIAGKAVSIVMAAVTAVAGDQVSKRVGEFAVVGALMSPIEDVVKGLNIPIVSSSLAAYPNTYPVAPRDLAMVPVLPALGAYAGGGGFSADPAAASMGYGGYGN